MHKLLLINVNNKNKIYLCFNLQLFALNIYVFFHIL